MASLSEGLTPAANLRRDFEYMLALVSDVFDVLHTCWLWLVLCSIYYVHAGPG